MFLTCCSTYFAYCNTPLADTNRPIYFRGNYNYYVQFKFTMYTRFSQRLELICSRTDEL